MKEKNLLYKYRVAKTHRMPYKLQVIFHQRAPNYRALVRKMTYTDKESYESTPLCTYRRGVRRTVLHDDDVLKILKNHCPRIFAM